MVEHWLDTIRPIGVNMTEQLIEWEKWEDPLLIKRLRSRIDVDLDEDDDDEHVLESRGPVKAGPSGLYPFHEGNCVSRYYNFWTGHTKFKMNRNDKRRIANVNGVESLNIYTRHRLRIAIGKAFDENDVMKRVSDLFHVRKSPSKKPRDVVDILGDGLALRWDFWAIIRNEEGGLSSLGSNNREDVNAALLKLENDKLEVVRSWDMR